MRLLLISPKDVYATTRLLEEARKRGVEMVHRHASDLGDVDVLGFDGLYARMVYPYYEAVAELAEKFKAAGKAAVAAGDTNKLEDYQKLSKAGIPMPKTFGFTGIGKLSYPFVIKTKYGFGNKEVFLCPNSRELGQVREKFSHKDLLVQEFIRPEWEYKVVIAGHKSLPKVLKFKTEGFGIDSQNYQIIDPAECLEAVKLAERSAQMLGRETAKVDLLESGGRIFVLEVNQSPGFMSFEHLTGINVAAAFLDEIVKKCYNIGT